VDLPQMLIIVHKEKA